jgi:uncharacterized protein YcbK (DUF882 family)
MSITLKEILNRTEYNTLSKEIQDNLIILLDKINKIRDKYGNPMTITSGFRSEQDHLRIYKNKGITDKSKVPMKSKHLYGQAVDIYDPDKKLQAWCKNNIHVLEEIGLWMEDFDHTPNWCHFQAVPPKSGNRFFKP